jgi:hypothetical protein
LLIALCHGTPLFKTINDIATELAKILLSVIVLQADRIRDWVAKWRCDMQPENCATQLENMDGYCYFSRQTKSRIPC